MNPSGAFWWDLFGRLILESSALITLAALVSRKLLPQQQRLVWQVALGALLLVLAVEGTGLHQRIHFPSVQVQPAPTARRLTIEVMPGPAISLPTAAQPFGVQQPSLVRWLPGVLWLVVCACILTRSFGSRLLFLALAHRRRRLNEPTLQEKVEALARKMNLHGRVHLSESRLLAGPIAFGFFRRCICLPEGFARAYASQEQEVTLAHELAHLAAGDPLWYALVDIIAAVFWFNPLAWLGRAQFQVACETAADEASLLVCEDGARTLAECLVQLGKRMAQVNSYGWIGIEGNRFRSALGRRVTRLLKLEPRPWRALSPRWTIAAWFAGVIISIALLSSSAAVARGRGYSLSDLLGQLRFAGGRVPNVQAAPTVTVTGGRAVGTRTFKVDPPRFEQSIKEFVEKNQIPPGDSFTHDLRFFIESLGVDLTPPARFFYNSQLGTLMVRADVATLDSLEKAVQLMNASPPQLTIETKFVEMSDPLEALDLRNLAISWDEHGSNSFRGVLSPSRYRELMKWLEARSGVDILTAPRVTTLSGRQAQIKVVDVRYVVTDLDYEVAPAKPIAEPFECGPVLDVIGTVRLDGMTIDLTLITTVREFMGYDLKMPYFDSGPPRPLTPAPLREYAGENANANTSASPVLGQKIPLPVFRLRQAQTKTPVWDGQTVVLGLPVSAGRSAKPNLRFARSGKRCFLLVTPVLIDPAGNALHNESTLPFVEQTVPR
ncbi:MAG TPA: M56 family metallopeptidase [Verrucomicrobiae bacterium]|nr:M56 family metallopeptidase [Verrucomicrobiae bacterium]